MSMIGTLCTKVKEEYKKQYIQLDLDKYVKDE